MRTILPLALLLPGCVLDVGLGPDLGACADYPDGPYTFGEAGIGTCLAGPSDLQFYTGLGGTWLAVTNADPFHNYLTGSLLLISMRDIAEDLRNDRFSPDQLVRDVSVDQLDAHALPMDSFVGAFAFDPLRPGLALVPSRLSADSLLTTEPDKLWLVDVSDPRAPRYAEPRAFLTVRQDPFTVRTSGDFAFVLSPTDDSIAVVDLRADPPELYDPAPESRIGDVTFSDADASGSRSELVATPFPASEIPSTETWTAAWIEGSTRLWVPEESGLARYAWGGAGEVPPARGGLGVELDPEPSLAITSVDDAFFVDNGEALSLHVPSGRTVYAAWWQPDFAVWAWDAASELRLPDDAWADRTGGPTLTEVGGRTLMFFDGALEGDPATAIGIATTTDGIRFSALDEPVIAPDGPWSRLAQPTVLGDPFAGDAAMWMSAWDGARWVVATSRSADGLTGWSTPEQALAVDGEDAGAPHVGWAAGRFRMWLTVSRGGAWWYATSESADGRVWSAPELHLEGPAITGDEDRPPRAAIQHVPTAAWRIEGSNTGPLDDLAFEAFATTDPATGATLRFASGAIIGTDIAGLLSRNGVEPGSWAEVAGVPTLYVTAIGADGRQRLMALRQAGDAWGVRASDLIPDGSGGNVLGVRAPTVFAVPGGWRMLYAAWGADGSWRIHQAASPDGVTWEPEGEALTSPPPWATSEQVPHAVEATDDGWRAWFAGGESGRLRIATMTSPDGATWTFEDVALEPGDPGTFDDRSVSDPMPARCGGVDGLWYTADDGERLAIGFAARADGAWQRW
ncbi:MAG TPA: hypothetical protein PKA64_04810, partial [Myxococcota bacterium]|nr:hypothetical protein [Myxococcota bacterium]